jgi:phage terminase large subunit-like protein
MTKPVRRLSASSINSLLPATRRKFLKALSDAEAEILAQDWRFWARDEQLAPTGLWRIWLYLGGRGAGKTRSGAEWIAEGVRRGRMRRVALIGATHADARAVMIEGASGLAGVSPGAVYEPSNRRVLWPNGAVATLLSAEEPDSIRGHQFDGAWADEFCKWQAPQAMLDMTLMALRLGKDPRLAVTTTPRNIAALKALLAAPDVALTRGATRDNAANLAPGFLGALEARFAGTRLGRQELEAELIEDNDSALWRRDWIETRRLSEAPELVRIVVAVDPPASLHGDECGIVVAGRGADGKGYVLADLSMGGLTPHAWAGRVADAYAQYQADAIVAEANQGGDMVRAVLIEAAPDAPVKLVHATRGKRVRATPAAALYESGRVHHVGVFAALEDQMCNYDGEGSSPDRMDALVWALADLFPSARAPRPRARSL